VVLAYFGYFIGVWIALRILRDREPTPAMAPG
jgi:hypothetical protein